MTEDTRNIDLLFKHGLENHEESAPNYIWGRIDDSLNKSRRKRLLLFTRSIAASIALLIAFGAGYIISESKYKKEMLADIDQPEKNMFVKEDIRNNTVEPVKIIKTSQSEDNQSSGIKENKAGFDKNTKNNYKNIVHFNNRNHSGIFGNYRLFDYKEKPFDFFHPKTEKFKRFPASEAKKQPEKDSVSTLYNPDQPLLADNTFPEYDKPAKKSGSWYIGGHVSPGYSQSSYTLVTETYVYQPPDPKKPTGKGEMVRQEVAENINTSFTMFSAGLSVKKDLPNRFSLQSGLYYSNKICHIQESIDQYFDYVEIPCIAKYSVIDRKLDVNLIAGISGNTLITNKTAYIQGENDIEYDRLDNANRFNFSSLAGIGVEYQLNDRVFYNFEPVFRYSFNSMVQDDNAYYFPYSFGVYTGVNISLN